MLQITRYAFTIILALTIFSCCKTSDKQQEKILAYYNDGKANLNLHNFPAAMEAFLHAEKYSEQSGNDSLLALSRRAMMDLSDSIYDGHGLGA